MESRDLIEGKLLPFLRQSVLDALNDAEHFRFDKGRPNQVTTICLYGSIVEMAHSCIAFLEKKEMTPLPIILRALLEAYADFRACIDDQNYYKNMYASFLEEKLRFLKAFERNPTNQYLQDAHGQIDIQTEKENLQEEIQAFTLENRPPLKTWQRFQNGKLEDEYHSMYWLLCLHSHNNLSALEDRHIEKSGDDFSVVLFKEENPDDLQRYLDTIISIVIESTVAIHNFLHTEKASRYEEHQQKLGKLRKEYVY